MAIIHPTLLPENAAPEPRRWSLAEFLRLDDQGFLGEEGVHYELLDGLILRKMGQNEPHIGALRLAVEALRNAFGDKFDVNCQLPLHLGEHDAPEPDVTVLRGTARDFARRHPSPSEVALLVEVADTRLDTARGPKVAIYARHGIAEYWILDLRGRSLEVRLGPRAEFGDWAEVRIYGESESVTPLGAAAPVKVSELLPPASA